MGERRGLLVVISGPSGVGKDAVIGALAQEQFPFTRVVTATTRARRENEVPGKDYHFLLPDEFLTWVIRGKFLENALVYGNRYGTPIAAVRSALLAGGTALLKIDVQGAARVKAKIPNAVFIYLGPGSYDELKDRLTRRQTETDDEYQQRIDQAKNELLQIPKYDYLVINRQDELRCAAEQVKAIIVAERLRTHSRQIDLF
jgi:guanylate kinase